MIFVTQKLSCFSKGPESTQKPTDLLLVIFYWWFCYDLLPRFLFCFECFLKKISRNVILG